MKYSCDIIRDLIPLYCDEICSEESAGAVEEHIGVCEECRKYCANMRLPDALEPDSVDADYEQRQADSIKKVKRKLRKKNSAAGAIGLAVGVVIAFWAVRLMAVAGAVGLLAWDSANSSIEVHEGIDRRIPEGIGRYSDYIGAAAVKPYRGKWGMDETIFPSAITEDMGVKEFRFVYYNPWDAEYAAYLTVEYTEDGYAEELGRLREKENESAVGYYGVSGGPQGYEILAMDADSYHGFVYALTPEGDGTTITYVMIIFCNNFLDLEIREYVPGEYLLEGFNAGIDKP